MPENIALLEDFFERGLIRIARGNIFDQEPDPKPADFDFTRVEGMMLGLAIGDALGKTSEGMPPHARRDRFGEITDYLPNRHAGMRLVGLPSDDTQLAFWTLEQMIADGGFVPEHVAQLFAQRRIFGIGRTVAAFLRNLQQGKPWHRCGPESAGNGALMRIAPMLIPHLHRRGRDLWVDTALSAMMTHNDSASIAACLAFIAMLWELLGMEAAPEPMWWVEAYVAIARELEIRFDYRSRAPGLESFQGALWQFVDRYVPQAFEEGLTTLEACNRWYSGAYLLETVPSVLYILMCHGHDPEHAILRAVNDTWDNDTCASIVGAAVGALHGAHALPQRWRANLLGRTMEDDDGRLFDLLEQARRVFWAAD